MPTAASPRELALDISRYVRDPLAFSYYNYEWGKGDLIESVGPRTWQAAILRTIREHLENPATQFTPLLIAIASGHGIGKSALIAMITDWGMSTCPDCKVITTANTGTQLATKTVPEVSKWFRLGLNAKWWNVKATSITINDEEHERSWRTDFIPWSEQNPEAFAGAHNKGKRIIVIYDEASGIAEIIWQTTEGALTDENTEIIWLAFGNPTKNTGRFRECFGKFKHRWLTFQIDSRQVEGTNKEQIAQWAADYGEDSDFFRVRVRGEFPRAGSSQFIPSDIVAACRKYKAEAYTALPKMLSCDVARFGDDQTIIGYRQGRKAVILEKLRGKDTVFVAERVIHWMGQERPDGTVVDGDGIGAGVIDHIRARNYGQNLFEFHGGATPNDSAMYFNKRAEVWGQMRTWLTAHAQIPDDPELESDLTSVEYGFSNKGAIQLEKKEDMKKRGLNSPDCGDMLAMTFAVNIAPKTRPLAPPLKPVSVWG